MDNETESNGQQANETAERLAKAYYPEILKFVRRKVPDKDAFDVTQEIFEHALENLLNRGKDTIHNERAWLYAIARHCISDFHKEQKKTLEVSLENDDYSFSDMLAGFDDPETETIYRDELRQTEHEIVALNPRLRKTMELIRQGYNTQEIALETGLSKSTIRAYLAQARGKIKPIIS